MVARDEQFESMLDADLKALDFALTDALKADVCDEGMIARIELSCDLHTALKRTPPDDLEDRLYAATADRIESQPAIAGRIGPWLRWAIAAAAAMVLAVLLYENEPMTTQPPMASNETLELAELEQSLEQIAVDAEWAGVVMEDWDADALALATEIDLYTTFAASLVLEEGWELSIEELEQILWTLEVDDVDF